MSSPQVIIRERDDSSYPTTSSNTVLAIVGYATKGPIDEPTVVVSRNDLLQRFGPAPSNSPWGMLAAYRAFNRTNRIIYYRVANDDAAAAEKAILNDRELSSGYQEFSQTGSVSFGNYVAQQVYDFRLSVDGGTARDVYIASPESGDWSLSNVASQINTQITSATSGFQEWSTRDNPTISDIASEYRFQVSVDGSDLQTTGGSASSDFSVFLDPGDTLSDIATLIDSAFSNGTHGYNAWDNGSSINPTTQTSLATSTPYDFNIAVDGGSITDVQITTLSNTPTWNEVADLMESAINSAVGSDSVYVRTWDNGIYVISQSTGTSSTITLADDNQAGTGDPLFDTLNSSGSFDTAVDGGAGSGSGYSVEVNDNTGRVRIISGSTGASSAVSISSPTFGTDIADILGSTLASNDGEASVPATASVNSDSEKVRISADSTGSNSEISISAGTGSDNTDLVALLNTDSAVSGQDAILAETTDNILFTAKDKGADTNNIMVNKTSSTDPVDGSTIHTVEVYYNDALQETFEDVSLDTTSSDFFVTKMNADEDNGGSIWVTVDYEDNDDDDSIDFPDGEHQLGEGNDAFQQGDALGDYDHVVGDNGIPSSGGSTLFVNALGSDSELANEELFDYHLILTPDNNAEATQNAAITLCQTVRSDCFYVSDPPFGLTYQEVAEWHNGNGSHGRGAAINSSYAATYWPWLKDFNPVSGEYVWSPPSQFMGEKFIETDNRFGPWYATAGDVRGRILGVSDIEASPSKPQRDLLYGGRNAVNPIVNFNARGITVFGQKTLLRQNSVLNRVNVRRMVIYVKKLIRNSMQGFIFEQNTPDTWARAENFIRQILEPVRQRNGLENYGVSINENTNSNVTDPTKAKGIIQLIPVNALETLDLTINLLNPGAEITEG